MPAYGTAKGAELSADGKPLSGAQAGPYGFEPRW